VLWQPTSPLVDVMSIRLRCHQLRRAARRKTTCIAWAAPAGPATRAKGDHNRGAVDDLSMRAIERLTGQTVKRVVPKGFGGVQILDALPGKPIGGPGTPRVIQSGRFVRVARDS